MIEPAVTLTPIEAYETAERQKRRLAEQFRRQIVRLYWNASGNRADLTPALEKLPGDQRRTRLDAFKYFIDCVRIAADKSGSIPDDAMICRAYRATVMEFGVKRIDPNSNEFESDLRRFHRNYVTNFPLPSEQETLSGFRTLLSAPPRANGYEEVGYSVACPLTGRYLMGTNFSIQPESDSSYFIYGFVSPMARGIGGFSDSLIELIRNRSRCVIAAYIERYPEDCPDYYDPHSPLILFEKNILEEMTLTDILMDSARIDIDQPPNASTQFGASAISQSMRDLVWERRGAKIVDYRYIQSSIDGVVRIPESDRARVISYLNGEALVARERQDAARSLERALGTLVSGCLTLNLCAFTAPDIRSVSAAQIRRSNEIFQGTSVVKDPACLSKDIYFKAQMASLEQNSLNGQLALKRIQPVGPDVKDFIDAEQITKRLLASLSWDELRDGREMPYREWLELKAHSLA